MTVAHEVHGNGPQHVVVMHDWMSTLRSYDDVRPYLDTERFSYAFMDHRGYGGSRGMSGTNSLREASQDVVDLADHLGWDRFDLVGHSMSAMVAQRVVLDARRRVRSLIAVTPVSAGGVPLDEDGRVIFASAATNDATWRMVSKMVTGERLPQRWHDAKLRQFRATVDPQSFQRFLDMWTGSNFVAEMVNLDTPALVLVGRHDFTAFSEQSVKQTFGAWFKDAKITVLQGAGHYPMSEVPLTFVAEMESFLSSPA